MTKKKPDFLRDLDTAIMDELTGGGIKGNAAGLVGTLTQIKEIKQLCGLPFCGYMAKVETVRPSGVPDEVTETYQKGEETIEATFGDSLPTLVDQIRKVR